MSDKQFIEEIIRAREALIDVKYFSYFDQGIVEILRLNFNKSHLYVSVNGEDDTIRIERDFPGKDEDWCQFAPHETWKNAYGKPILWLWYMENNQGYEDGLQFEFAQDAADKSICVQIIAVASQLSIKLVSDL